MSEYELIELERLLDIIGQEATPKGKTLITIRILDQSMHLPRDITLQAFEKFRELIATARRVNRLEEWATRRQAAAAKRAAAASPPNEM